MFGALKLQVSNPAINLNCNNHNLPTNIDSQSRPLVLRLPPLGFSSTSLNSQDGSSKPWISSHFTSSVGSSPSSSLHLSQSNLTHRHIVVLNVLACAVAVSTTWLFCYAIPTLLAFKRAAESLEKLLDVTREELPDTMAAIRLSGMEISDLTMELSDMGQEITQGVRSSTRAIRVAEERLRGLTNMTPSASMQKVVKLKVEPAGPVLARTARGIRLGIVKGSTILQIFLSLKPISRMALKFFASRAKR